MTGLTLPEQQRVEVLKRVLHAWIGATRAQRAAEAEQRAAERAAKRAERAQRAAEAEERAAERAAERAERAAEAEELKAERAAEAEELKAEALAVRKDEAKLRVITELAADVSPRVRSLWAAVAALPEGGATLYGLAAIAQSNSTSGFHGVFFHSHSSTFRYSFEGTSHSATTALAAALELVLATVGGSRALLAFNEAWV